MIDRKDEVRRHLKARRDGMGEQLRGRLSEQIATHALRCVVEAKSSVVGLYSAISSEVDTSFLFKSMPEKVKVVYPRVRKGGLLEFACVERLESLVPGPFGVLEPPGSVCPTEDIDCLFVPGLGFTRAGGRLGYGGGYYDRLLPLVSGQVFGLAFESQVIDDLPLEAHDQALDGLVTECGVIGFPA